MLPLAQKLFDYGVFDEASQMFLERSYPILYRCALNIVAGDEKQLKPTNFLVHEIMRLKMMIMTLIKLKVY